MTGWCSANWYRAKLLVETEVVTERACDVPGHHSELLFRLVRGSHNGLIIPLSSWFCKTLTALTVVDSPGAQCAESARGGSAKAGQDRKTTG